MEQNEQLKDWTFRYQYLYRLRRTNKQKKRFLSALVMDIAKMRKDIRVIEYKQNKKYMSSNLYVGDIETVEKIICTYYDTPPQSLGAYDLFNRKKQSKSVINFIFISSIFSLLVGLGLTLLYMNNSDAAFDFTSLTTLLVIACYGVYFYLFNKVTKGLSNRRNLVRNTSSVLSILSLIANVENKKIAFAFIDEGCFGDRGFAVLKDMCKASAKIYSFDCVGADTDLHFMWEDSDNKKLEPLTVHHQPASQVTHIFGARVAESEQGDFYYLEKSDLKKKELKQENLATIIDFFN